jgi:hypothetical protein
MFCPCRVRNNFFIIIIYLLLKVNKEIISQPARAYTCVCVCVCARARVRACVRVCVLCVCTANLAGLKTRPFQPSVQSSVKRSDDTREHNTVMQTDTLCTNSDTGRIHILQLASVH